MNNRRTLVYLEFPRKYVEGPSKFQNVSFVLRYGLKFMEIARATLKYGFTCVVHLSTIRMMDTYLVLARMVIIGKITSGV